MIDPHNVVFLAGLIGIVLVGWLSRNGIAVLITGVLYSFLLVAISYSAGYPTNSSFPSHAIVYGLTQDHVWAAPKDNPYPPRAYIFKAPPEWHEERDKRKGQPFEVEEKAGEEMQPGGDVSDRTSEGHYIIHQHILPPKDEG